MRDAILRINTRTTWKQQKNERLFFKTFIMSLFVSIESLMEKIRSMLILYPISKYTHTHTHFNVLEVRLAHFDWSHVFFVLWKSFSLFSSCFRKNKKKIFLCFISFNQHSSRSLSISHFHDDLKDDRNLSLFIFFYYKRIKWKRFTMILPNVCRTQ